MHAKTPLYVNPAVSIAQQSEAARIVQRAWRRKKQDSAQRDVRFNPSAPSLLGVPYLSVDDGLAFRCVSTWHGGFFTALLDATFERLDETVV